MRWASLKEVYAVVASGEGLALPEVSECKRLQTVPEWFDFSVISNTQAYKCLGNGWTVEVIAHLIKCALNQQTDKSRLDYWI